MVGIPSESEKEYFVKQEVERLKKLREEHLAKSKEAERAKMKEAHWMHCTKCGQHMETTTLDTIEVEVCPDCGGVFLDAGELGKMLDEKRRGAFSETLGMIRKFWG